MKQYKHHALRVFLIAVVVALTIAFIAWQATRIDRFVIEDATMVEIDSDTDVSDENPLE